jgi:EAL domain-containing protein (putative c-di-GMP-specific phosphodiesterase class I)
VSCSATRTSRSTEPRPSARTSTRPSTRTAIGERQFELYYQPIFNLRNACVTGVEALLRWEHPERGLLTPEVFIDVLEESGMIVEIGRWVLAEACRQTASWHRNGWELDVSVNLSFRQLAAESLADDVREALDSSGLPPSSLILEIAESSIMRDADAIAGRLNAVKGIGVRIAIDDFGTGYSSLAYLRQFPVDALKIDRSFINAIAESHQASALIHTLVQLGKTLGLETLAEGIEDHVQYQQLQRERCDSGQGFLLARPLDVESLEQFLQEVPDAARSMVLF